MEETPIPSEQKKPYWQRIPPEALARLRERELYLKEVDPATKTEFKELAKVFFGNSYGSTLKYLVDCNKAMGISQSEELAQKVELMAESIAQIQAQIDALKTEPERKPRKMNDGTVKL